MIVKAAPHLHSARITHDDYARMRQVYVFCIVARNCHNIRSELF